MELGGGESDPPSVVVSINRDEYLVDGDGNAYLTFTDPAVLGSLINKLVINGLEVLGGTQ